MLTFNPHIPLALWLPLTLTAMVLVVAYAIFSAARLPRARWAWIIALMSVTLAAPLVILLNPMWVEQVPPPPGEPLLTVLVDRSLSMATDDGDERGRTRYAASSEFARAAASDLADEYEIRVRLFDEKSSLTDTQQLAQSTPDGPSTSLSAAIDDALGEDRPQGQAILLLSDGIDTSAAGEVRLRQVAEKAKALSTPVYTRTIGTQQGVRDLQLTLNLSQELAFVGQKVPIVVRLSHSHPLPQTTQLSLSHDGIEIESREVSIAAGGFAEEVLYVSQDESGLYRYEVAAAPLDDEVTELNNTATLLLRVVDQPVAVLLLEGKPYWDTKFLIRTLAADPSMELTSIVQMAPGRFLERTIERTLPTEANGEGSDEPADSVLSTEDSAPSTAPVRNQWKIHTDARRLLADKDYLSHFQIVVLGRNTETYLTDEALTGLRGWLQDGDGSLVCFRGSPASQITQRLGALMPVRWSPGRESRFRLSLTDSGQAMQWLPESGGTLSQLPSLAASARPEEPKPLATVLATDGADADAVPLITYRPEGNGRVVVVEGAGMWRWAFLPPDHQDHDAVYGTLWRSLVRWLVSNVGLLPSERAALRPDAVTYAATQAASATLLLREDQWSDVPVVELSGGELAKPQAVAAAPQGSGGVYRVNFGHLPEGSYAARVVGAAEGETSATTAFDVIGNLRERLDIVVRPKAMEDLASRSGGAVLASDDSGDLPAELHNAFTEHRNNSRPQRVIRASAWDRWWILLAVFGLWAFTWGLRRWSGLI